MALSWHERHARGRAHLCEVIDLPGYPYPCRSADLRPDDIVRQCVTHGAWWSVDPETGEDRTDQLNAALEARRPFRLR